MASAENTSTPSLLQVKCRYVGGDRRAVYRWILEALPNGDSTSAQDDEVREKTVLRVDLYEHDEEAFPPDKRTRIVGSRHTGLVPLSPRSLSAIRHIDLRVLQLYHMGAKTGSDLSRPDADSHLERYTVKLSQGSDGEVSLQSIEREILNVCNALEMYVEGGPAEEAVRQHRAETMQALADEVGYHLANMAELKYDLPYLIGMIITSWNGDAPRFQEEVLDGEGNVMAMCGRQWDAAELYQRAKGLPDAVWEAVEDGEDNEESKE
ncbi:hypothetical protein PRZ48_008958 [Zasmidium cellare]|uniref:Uncharacterized protein n=1 Tax=Zasmidium cellare TaxID=395010 RepID=A0ABR0EI62_ZASCE|nr:hypothetical protein PRZ48_008958 [Zasmidium cellare]